MKNVLIVGFFHPFTIPGGSFRVLPLMRHLPDFGWRPTILTPRLLENRGLSYSVVETDYHSIFHFWEQLLGFKREETFKRQLQSRLGSNSQNKFSDFVMNRIGEVVNYPDPNRGWKRFAVEAGTKLLSENKFDVLLSCHPTASHIIAHQLKKQFGLPWVSDLPDLWSRNHNYRYSVFRRMLDARLEKKTFSTADVMTTVSEPWAETLRQLHGNKVISIQHGYPPEEFNEVEAPVTEKFTVTFTGSFYSEGQDFSPLFEAVRQLIDEEVLDRDDIEIRFYGAPSSVLEKSFEKFGITQCCRQYGKITRSETVARQRDTQVLLFVKWESGNQVGWYSGKIYEYLAARRPILAVGGRRDVVTELLKETHAGDDAYETDSVKKILKSQYLEYKKTGRVSYSGVVSEIAKYSHHEMTRQFVELFESLHKSG